MLEKDSRPARLSRPITWHDFRRTFAGHHWDAKIDGVTIQKRLEMLPGTKPQSMTVGQKQREGKLSKSCICPLNGMRKIMDSTKAMLPVDRLERRVKESMEVLVWEDANKAMEELQPARFELDTLRRFLEQEAAQSSDD